MIKVMRSKSYEFYLMVHPRLEEKSSPQRVLDALVHSNLCISNIRKEFVSYDKHTKKNNAQQIRKNDRITEFGLKKSSILQIFLGLFCLLVVDVGFCCGCYSVLFTAVGLLFRALPGTQ